MAVGPPTHSGSSCCSRAAVRTTLTCSARGSGPSIATRVELTDRRAGTATPSTDGWRSPRGRGLSCSSCGSTAGRIMRLIGIHLFDERRLCPWTPATPSTYCNPRGSAGYGRGARAQHPPGQWERSTSPTSSTFSTGAVSADQRLDGGRGGRHRRYVWGTPPRVGDRAHDLSFAGAIVERGFPGALSSRARATSAPASATSTSGVDADAMARLGLFLVVGQVATPTLVMHSELDLRCPLEQATRSYSALKRAGGTGRAARVPRRGPRADARGAAEAPSRSVSNAVLDWWRRDAPGSTERPAAARKAPRSDYPGRLSVDTRLQRSFFPKVKARTI